MLGDDVDIQALAKKTESFSGSDLKRQSDNGSLSTVIDILPTDLCVSAALDAVKENILLPWSTPDIPPPLQRDTSPQSVPSGVGVSIKAPSPSPSDSSPSTSPSDDQLPRLRTLRLRNFTKALKEITPSSEALGSLADLRKWNDEFGEGRRDKKRKQFWGKDRFGFTDSGHGRGDNGRVLSIPPDISKSKAV
jgi:SpoVK/Ycf46/Vps4 family AAA+-type ATPase